MLISQEINTFEIRINGLFLYKRCCYNHSLNKFNRKMEESKQHFYKITETTLP
jgi:hypothetical protein